MGSTWGKLFCVTAVAAAFVFAFAHAEDSTAPIVATSDLEVVGLGPRLQLLEDPGGTLGIAEVAAAPNAGRFAPSERDSTNFGFTTSAWWARFSVSNPGNETHSVLLRQDYPLIDFVDLWYRGSDGQWQHQGTGDRRPFDSRPIAHRDFVFPLELPPQTTRTYYVRFASAGPVNIGLQLYSQEELIQAVSSEQLAYGIYYGGFIVLVFYNFFIFMVVRDRAFLYYLLYVSSYGLYMAVHNGLTYQYLWPDSPNWGNESLLVLLSLTLVFGLEFSRRFLDIAQRAPFQDRVVTGLQAASVGGLLVSFFLPYSTIIVPISGLTLLVTIHILVMGTTSLLSGYRPARFFMLAWIMLLLGVVVYMLKTFGVLPHNAFTQNAFQAGSLVEMVLLALALASRVRELQRQSLTDPLTQLPNRRVFDERLIQAFDRAKQARQPLSLLMIDIDHFKSFNDRLGHDRGDDALQVVGQILRQSTRKPNTVSRFGGEEFAMILPGTDREAAEFLAERLRRRVEDASIGGGEHVTVSIGIASLSDTDYGDENEFFRAADSALYKAKETGRNRVVHYDADMELRAHA